MMNVRDVERLMTRSVLLFIHHSSFRIHHFLERCARGFVAHVGARVEYVSHLAHDAFDLFVLRVEVRRDAYARARSVVNYDLAADEFARDGGRVLDGDCDCAAAPLGLAWARDAEARLLGERDEELSLPHALLAYRRDPDLVDNLVARLGGVERGHGGRAVEESRRALGVSDGRVLEGEGRGVSHPARDLRLKGLLKTRRDVEVARAWAAAEPLDGAARREVNVQVFDAEGNRARRLVSVEDDERADLVRSLCYGARVLQRGALEEDVREWDEQSLFVNGREQAFERYRDAVVRLDLLDSESAVARVRLVGVHDGREFELGVDDLVASRLGRGVEAGEDDGHADRDVLVHRDRASVGPDDSADLVAHGERHLPPAFGPRAHAARRPGFGVGVQALERLARHRAEAVRD